MVAPMTTIDAIRRRLAEALAPGHLEVEDDSARHHGHAGWRAGEVTHVTVTVVAAAFAGKPRLERHRMVNAALAPEFAAGLHALAVKASAPGER